MSDYFQLISRLREPFSDFQNHEAADALAIVLAERDALAARVRELEAERDNLIHDIGRAQAALTGFATESEELRSALASVLEIAERNERGPVIHAARIALGNAQIARDGML